MRFLSPVLQILLLPLRIFPYLYFRIRGAGSLPWVHLEIRGKYEESGIVTGWSTFLKSPEPRFFDLILDLMQIRDNVAKLKLKEFTVSIHQPEIGWSRAWELNRLLRQISEKGVKVRTYLLSVDTLSYFIALGGNEIHLPPATTVDLLGFSSENLYFRDLFDRLKIRPNFIHIGRFKSAGERFTARKASSFAKAQLQQLLNDRQQVFSSALQHRGKAPDAAKIQKISPLTPEEAVSLGLAESVCYEGQLLERIAKENGWKEHRKPAAEHAALTRLHRKSRRLFRFRKPLQFQLLTASGPIIDAREPNPSVISYSDYHNAIADMRGRRADALIIRINSPGGSALISDLLWQDLMNLIHGEEYPENLPGRSIAAENAEKSGKAEEKKPLKVIVSQSDVAASGGYYLSAVPGRIFATPMTVTGSIGVIGGKFNFRRFLENQGITLDGGSSGANADLYSPFSDFTSAQAKRMAQSMESMYSLFRHRVGIGRGLDDRTIHKLGEGRVYSGLEAGRNRLIDENGGLADAIDTLLKEADPNRRRRLEITVWPRIRAPLFSRSGLVPGFLSRLKVLNQFAREQVFFLDERFLL